MPREENGCEGIEREREREGEGGEEVYPRWTQCAVRREGGSINAAL